MKRQLNFDGGTGIASIIPLAVGAGIVALAAATLPQVIGVSRAPKVPPPTIFSVHPAQGQAPVRQPQPGAVGGGNEPGFEVLSMVPRGLYPVAVFPNADAICVIFSESDERSIRADGFIHQQSSLRRIDSNFMRMLNRRRFESVSNGGHLNAYVTTVERRYGFTCKVPNNNCACG